MLSNFLTSPTGWALSPVTPVMSDCHLDCGTPGSLSLATSRSLPKFDVHCIDYAAWLISSSDALLLLPSILPSTRGLFLGWVGMAIPILQVSRLQAPGEARIRIQSCPRLSPLSLRGTRCPLFCWCLSMNHKLRA